MAIESRPERPGMIEVPPVELRETSEHELDAYLDLYLRNREFLRPFEPTRPDSFFTRDGMASDLARSVRDRRSDWQFTFGIWHRGSGKLIGRVSLSNVVRGAWQNATLGYFVAEASNGRGYATWAVREALAFAFGWADLHRVQAAIMPSNARSVRVVEKNGFRHEGLARRYLKINGRWEDHDVYAV